MSTRKDRGARQLSPVVGGHPAEQPLVRLVVPCNLNIDEKTTAEQARGPFQSLTAYCRRCTKACKTEALLDVSFTQSIGWSQRTAVKKGLPASCDNNEPAPLSPL